ncbi:Hsp20/alpha crystallin family protein [bacterium]|nr:Hsp20/alpha crystallin family protein [bacterium]
MALIRWEPFREIDTIQREMNRLFEDLSGTKKGEVNGLAFIPAAEMTETPEAVHLKLEIPGLTPEDLHIEATAEAVAVSGERKSERRSQENGVTRTEFHYGKFRRVIPLAVRIDNTTVTAEYKDGILTLTLPKVEEERNKVVKVNIG